MDAGQNQILFDRAQAEHGRLDILACAVWGQRTLCRSCMEATILECAGGILGRPHGCRAAGVLDFGATGRTADVRAAVRNDRGNQRADY